MSDKPMGQFEQGAEAMRARVLELIRGWLTDSNASNLPHVPNVLNALAGDVMIAKVERER